MRPTSLTLTDDPWEHPHVFAAAFNSGDPDEVERVYETQGLLVTEPGSPSTGSERRAANAGLLGLGLPIEVTPRHVYVNDGLALMIVDWRITGTGPTGAWVDIRGTATDVARQGEDGLWRYVIDNPWGVADGRPAEPV